MAETGLEVDPQRLSWTTKSVFARHRSSQELRNEKDDTVIKLYDDTIEFVWRGGQYEYRNAS